MSHTPVKWCFCNTCLIHQDIWDNEEDGFWDDYEDDIVTKDQEGKQ